MKLYYRLGTIAEKSLFKEMRESYYGIVVGAHLLSLYPSALPSFLKEIKKPFFIDPVSYVFGRAREIIKKNEELKRSFDVLIKKKFSKLSRNILSNRNFIPKDFSNEELLKDFVKSTIEFQRNIFKEYISQKSLALEQLSENSALLKPEFLVAPYFYFENIEDPWYRITLEMCKVSKNIYLDERIFGVLCFHKDILCDENQRDTIVKDISNQETDGIIIWISNFDETNDRGYINFFVEFLKMLRKMYKKEIINLFGGYFSLCCKFWLDGYAQGICYGDKKDVNSISTGLPAFRYYLPMIHHKISESSLRLLLSKYPLHTLCQCEICKGFENIEEIEEIMQKLKKDGNLLKHFMLTHQREVETFKKLSLSQIRNLLESDYKKCEEYKLSEIGIEWRHLKLWKNSLKE